MIGDGNRNSRNNAALGSSCVTWPYNGQTVEVAVRICQPSPRGALGRFWSNRPLGS